MRLGTKKNSQLTKTYSRNLSGTFYSRLSLSRTRLSRITAYLEGSENLVSVLTQRSTKRHQNIVEKRRNSPLFHNIFNISLTWESNYILILLKSVVRLIVFLSSAKLICRSTDISKCFIEVLGFRDNESGLYFGYGNILELVLM